VNSGRAADGHRLVGGERTVARGIEGDDLAADIRLSHGYREAAERLFAANAIEDTNSR